MSLALTLSAAAHREVLTEVDGARLVWRLRRITQEDSLRAGGGLMLAMAESMGMDFADADPADQVARLKQMAATMGDVGETLAAGKRVTAAGICAAVVAVKAEGDVFEPIRLVLDAEKENPAEGVVHISVLTDTVFATLAEAVKVLGQGEGIGEALATFRGREGATDTDAA